MTEDKLGPYEIIEEVGRGGMATVYRAHQPRVGRDVAVKVIHQPIGGASALNDEAVIRFQREARLIARLEHPHILPVYDFDGGHEPPYIVMRYLDGGTLKEMLNDRRIKISETRLILEQVAGALDYAHRQGVIHRDVKPSNIMIDRAGNAIVADFGIARISHDSEKQITGTGVAVGTPDYMAPEQARGLGNIDRRADIYSLAAMAFEMLSGRLPFIAETKVGVLLMHISDSPPDICEHNPDLLPGVNEVIQKALAKKPDQRHPSAIAFVTELIQALGDPLIGTAAHLQAGGHKSMRPPKSHPAKNSTLRSEIESSASPGEQNRSITVLYANASEYAEIIEEIHGPEKARQAMKELWVEAIRQIVERGGEILERTERYLLALWGINITLESDTERAVFAALDIQEILRRQMKDLLAGTYWTDVDKTSHEEALPINIGVNTGLALIVRSGDGSTTASGATISLAQRMAENAHGGIMIGSDTFRQVQGVFSIVSEPPFQLRGRKEIIHIYRVIEAKARAFRIKARGVEGVETRMVGRQAALKQMQYAYLDALEEHESQMVTVISEAGLGKSRLLFEFTQWAEVYPAKYRVFRGRATFAVANAPNRRPYALLRDIMAFRFEILDSDSPEVVCQKLEAGVIELVNGSQEMAHMIGYLCGFNLSESAYITGLLDDPEQLSARARQLTLRLFEQLGNIQPVVIAIEDAHYADDASINLLIDILRQHDRLQIVLIFLARPALLEAHPNWARGLNFHRLITLEPLDRRESRELVAEILKHVGEIPRQLRDLIVERGEGNPLYIEELVKMLIEDHVIIKEDPETWRVESSRIGSLRVPATLVGVLQARFDSLLHPEKIALQRAAVVGQVFYDSAITSLDGVDDRWLDELPRILEGLSEREFIYPRETSAFTGSNEFIFAQHMLRDQIYATLLARHRQAYHKGVAQWLAQTAGDRIAEYTPVIAGHYQTAGQPHKAAAYLVEAGKHALSLSTFAEARRLLERALVLLPEQAVEDRLGALLALADVLIKLGEFDPAEQHLLRALPLAVDLENPAAQAESLYHLSQIATQRGDWETAKKCLAEALPLATEAGQSESLAWTLYGLADTHYRSADLDVSRAYIKQALDLAHQTGNRAVERAAINRLATILWLNYGEEPGQIEEAAELLQEALTLAQQAGDRRTALSALVNLGAIQRDLGDHQASIRYNQEALVQAREIGSTVGIIVAALNLTIEHCLAGKTDLARPLIGEAIQLARRIGSETWLAAGLVGLGALRTVEGSVQEGLALLGLARDHPAAGGDEHKEIRYVISGLLEPNLSQEEIEQGMQASQELDAISVIDTFLSEIGK